jgi:hypothetical protein
VGNFFSDSKLQKQYNYCEICLSNKITYDSCFVTRHLQGDIYFRCENNHSFHTYTFGKTYEEINYEFSKNKTLSIHFD